MWSNCYYFVLVTSSWLDSQSFKICLEILFICCPAHDVNKPQNGLFQKKFKQGRLRIYFCENCPAIFHFFTLSLEIPDKTKLNHWIFHKIVLDPLKIPGPKTRPMEIPHYFFLVTLRNSTSFLINPQKFHLLFL